MMQEIILIAAVAENRVIGKDNAMPWNIKGNLAHFKEMTMGYPCVMGRKTWESLPKKPLPGRLNIIISKTMKQENISQEIKFFNSLSTAIEFYKDYKKIFICGGESIYKQAMPFATNIDLTLIHGNYDGDTFFPEIDNSWIKTETVKLEEFSIINYIRKDKEQL